MLVSANEPVYESHTSMTPSFLNDLTASSQLLLVSEHFLGVTTTWRCCANESQSVFSDSWSPAR